MSILTVLICSSITTTSQTIIDSCTCIPNKDLIKGAQMIEKGKLDAALLQQANSKIEFLNERIATKEAEIRQYQLDTVTNAAIIQTYKDEVQNLKEQRDIAVKSVKDLDKALRRQKRKTVIAVIATATATTLIFTLIK